ncbi:MAG: isopentenyl transferase family protein, partial [Alphaproteobacteria bacterium]
MRDEESATSVLIVTGPTAGGKSGLALELAERLGGWIINADSMQVYRDLRVLTARPDAADEARVPHRLFGVLGAEERCSVGRWLDMAVAEIKAARAANCLPILVGGTGMYLKALTEGLAPVPDVPAAVTAEATALYD